MMWMKKDGPMSIQIHPMDKVETFFNTIKNTALKAVKQQSEERCYTIADFTVKLVFAGSALIPHITPALEHLRTPLSTDPDLIVYLWDSQSTYVAIPANNWKSDDYLEHGLIKEYNTNLISTTFNLGSGILSMYHRKEKTAIFWIRDAKDVPYYETGSPLRDIISWWAVEHGMQYAHAAAVGGKEGAVLLVGKGGSGKSTSALSCLASEDLFYIGDDYVLLSNDPNPHVYSLYNSAKLNADHALHFPYLLKEVSNPDKLDREKALLFIRDIYPEKIIKGMPLKAVIMPKVTGLPTSSYSTALPSLALRALAPSSMFQLPGSTQRTFTFFSRLVRHLPAYTLHAGLSYHEIPEMLISILKEDQYVR